MTLRNEQPVLLELFDRRSDLGAFVHLKSHVLLALEDHFLRIRIDLVVTAGTPMHGRTFHQVHLLALLLRPGFHVCLIKDSFLQAGIRPGQFGLPRQRFHFLKLIYLFPGFASCKEYIVAFSVFDLVPFYCTA